LFARWLAVKNCHGGAGVDRGEPIEAPASVDHAVQHIERVRLDELVTAIVRLRVDVDTDDIEARALVAPGAAAGTAEQLEQPRFH
jgi:hypothetical protein